MTKYVTLDEVIEEPFSEFMMLDVSLKTSEVFEKANFWHC